MGRRKIEIRAIKDDRNRSVTFLKRKGGLFKKAHELSVLCSVDVAVIIFGSNKKLYEYSSCDIGEILSRYQYYGGPNEHKGPADFNGGTGGDDDDDEDGSGPSIHGGSVEPQMMPPQYQHQPALQHIRHQTPSASPPIPSAGFAGHPQQRQQTPQPQGGSRPSSRNAVRRSSSNLGPQHPPPPPPPPANGYSYMSHPTGYHQHNGQPVQHPHALPQHMQAPPMQGPPPGMPQQAPGAQYPGYGQSAPQHPPQPGPQMYMEDQRRDSMPPAYPPQERPQSHPDFSPPPPQQQQQHLPPHPPPEPEQQPTQQLLEPVQRLSVKSRSIFTPIDERRSILSQHWESSTSHAETARSDTATSNARSHSITSPPLPRAQIHHKPRNPSLSSVSDSFRPPSRTNSAQLGGGGKRPVLTVQIPEEPSDAGSAATDSLSPRSSTQAPNRAGVVLPPPSPSASTLLSAGTSGPPNPFARPHPVSQPSQNSTTTNGTGGGSKDFIDTPVSALPSRFMTGTDFLPSPSSFYPEWNFGSREGNTLPSPLNFATPVVGTGPSFLREDSGERAGGGGLVGGAKRKTPEAEGSGDFKRAKIEGS